MIRLTYLLLLSACLLLGHNSAQAEVYKYRDANGNVVLTDQAKAGAEKVEERPVMTLPPPKDPGLTPLPTDAAVAYRLRITSPANGSNYQINSGTPLLVKLAIEPAPQNASLTLVVDGKEGAFGRGTEQYEVSVQERGTHTLQAQLLSDKGKVLASSAVVTINAQQPSRLLPAMKKGK